MAQGCSLSPILFSVFINVLLEEVEKAELGVHLGEGESTNGLHFSAFHFSGITSTSTTITWMKCIMRQASCHCFPCF